MAADPASQAVQFVANATAGQSKADRARLQRALGGSVDQEMVTTLISGFLQRRLTVNFHPDRFREDRTSVAEALLRSGRYLPQSITGLSNGERSAVPGGRRMEWERELFGAAYDTDDDPSARPIYGALDVTHDPFGGTPRFGSSFLVLSPHCIDRATLCIGDSHVGPTDLGTAREPMALLAGLFEQAATGNALDRGIDTAALLELLTNGGASPKPSRELDHYVEAQIHGGVSLQSDVATIVLDPSFRDTDVDQFLTEAAERYSFALDWHCGSALSAADIPDDFRGASVAELGRALAPLGLLNAATIGRSAAEIPFTPLSPGGDAPDSALQQHKKLWHCLLAFGQSAAGASD